VQERLGIVEYCGELMQTKFRSGCDVKAVEEEYCGAARMFT
jgi:hypothetical protein